jgi:hypothetical protein
MSVHQEKSSAIHAAQAIAAAIAAALIATACGSIPDIPANGGPTVGVLPGGGKSMPEFNKDDIACRDTAKVKAKDNSPLPVAMGLGKPEIVASARSRVTVRQSGESTTGSVFGNAPAPDPGNVTPQQRYDTAYVQCMFSKGHKIPVGEAMSS